MNEDVILIVGGFKLPNGNASAHRAIENARLIAKSGFKPVILGKFSDDEGNKRYIDGVLCYPIDSPKYIKPYNKDISSIMDCIENIGQNKVHSIIAYNYPPIALIKLKKYCYQKNIQLILDLTEWYAWEGVGLARDTIRYLATELRMRYIAKKVDKIICTSNYLRKYYPEVQTYVLPFSTDKTRSVWQHFTNKRINEITKFAYAGVPGPRMKKDSVDLIISGFHYLVEKNHKLNFELNLVGFTKKQYLDVYPEHTSWIEKLNNKIKFHGRLPHKETLEQVRKADFTILIRPDNKVSNVGFSTKIVESFACSTPVITNNTSDISNYVINNNNGLLINDLSLDGISQVLKTAITLDHEDLKVMISKCEDENPFLMERYLDSFKKFLLGK